MRVKILTLLTVCIGLISFSSFAAKNNSLFDALTTCSKIMDNAQRLMCFDKIAKNNLMSSSSIDKHSKSVLQAEQARLEEAKKIDDFSKEDLILTKEEQGPESISATISSVKKLIRGQWVVYLENGQKWQQQDSGRIKLKVGDSIRLKKGSMGAVYLFKEGSHKNIRVKRLK